MSDENPYQSPLANDDLKTRAASPSTLASVLPGRNWPIFLCVLSILLAIELLYPVLIVRQGGVVTLQQSLLGMLASDLLGENRPGTRWLAALLLALTAAFNWGFALLVAEKVSSRFRGGGKSQTPTHSADQES